MSQEDYNDDMSAFLIKDVTAFAKDLRSSIIQQLIDAKEILPPKNGSKFNKNSLITVKQVSKIILDNILSINEKNEFIVDMDCMDQIYLNVCDNIHGTLISKLAAKGIIETAFDEEKNKFIFWFSDQS